MPQDIPPNSNAQHDAAFDTLPLPAAMRANLAQIGYLNMTPVQAATLPLALAGQDLIAQARTGSGKTAAFALPLLLRLEVSRMAVQAMVLCPTRELAEQVAQEIRRLARFAGNIKVLTLCGGHTMRPQRDSLAHGAHVVVGTPGRIMDHLDRGSLVLDGLTTLVLDEADRMLDMGFHDNIVYIASHCPAARQTLLFSATFPEGITRLAARFMRSPQTVMLTEQHDADTIRERHYRVADGERLPAVGRLLRHYRPASTLAFCNTRQQCRDLVAQLESEGIEALTLNGELEQRERDQVLIRFANRSCAVLVATDVAARGLDIAELEAVINVDVTPEPEVHIHRIGRTGRGAHAGWAFTLAGPADERRLAAIAAVSGREPEWHALSELDGGEAEHTPLVPPMVTLLILGGRKDKLRPGDVLGALTGEAGFSRDDVGKINVTDQHTYVAVRREIAADAVRKLAAGRLKGRQVKVRALGQ